MKTNCVFALAAVALTVLSSCNKNTGTALPEPVTPGEFYIRASVNGQPLNIANSIDGAKLNGPYGLSIGLANITGPVNTSGCKFETPAGAMAIGMSLDNSLLSRLGSLPGQRLPFIVNDVVNNVATANGVVLDISHPANWQYSWLAGGNYNSNRYYADIISVTPYNKGAYTSNSGRDFFRVTLRFNCRLLTQSGEVDAVNGEAAILVARQR